MSHIRDGDICPDDVLLFKAQTLLQNSTVAQALEKPITTWVKRKRPTTLPIVESWKHVEIGQHADGTSSDLMKPDC